MTYYIVKSSRLTLREVYLILHMIEHYKTPQEAKEVISKADPDIIPKDSLVYMVEEISTDFDWPTVTVNIKMSPVQGNITGYYM